MRIRNSFESLKSALDGDRLDLALFNKRVTPDEAMDCLQDQGIVSDCAVQLQDVALVDREAAAEWIERNL